MLHGLSVAAEEGASRTEVLGEAVVQHNVFNEAEAIIESVVGNGSHHDLGATAGQGPYNVLGSRGYLIQGEQDGVLSAHGERQSISCGELPVEVRHTVDVDF